MLFGGLLCCELIYYTRYSSICRVIYRSQLLKVDLSADRCRAAQPQWVVAGLGTGRVGACYVLVSRVYRAHR